MKFIGIRSYDGKNSMIIHIIVHIASFFWFVDVGGGGGEIIQNQFDIWRGGIGIFFLLASPKSTRERLLFSEFFPEKPTANTGKASTFNQLPK